MGMLASNRGQTYPNLHIIPQTKNPTNVGLDAGIIRLFHFLFNSSNVRPVESFHLVQPFVDRPNTVEAA